MIKFTLTVALLLTLSFNSNAQIGNISEDSVRSLLCRKWGFRAIIMAGQELTNMNESITYEFYNDYNFQRITSKGKLEKGKWSFDPSKNIIILKIKKKDLYVRKLSPGDLVITSDSGLDSKENSIDMGTAFKVINE